MRKRYGKKEMGKKNGKRKCKEVDLGVVDRDEIVALAVNEEDRTLYDLYGVIGIEDGRSENADEADEGARNGTNGHIGTEIKTLK